jgi:hypothetical protein
VGKWYAEIVNLDGTVTLEEIDPLLTYGYGNRNKRWNISDDVITPYGEVFVSTAFLSLDHSWEEGKVLVYETMIFGCEGPNDFCRRYSTREEAIRGHNEIIEKLRASALTVD